MALAFVVSVIASYVCGVFVISIVCRLSVSYYNKIVKYFAIAILYCHIRTS